MVGHGFIKRAQGFYTGGARDEVKVRLTSTRMSSREPLPAHVPLLGNTASKKDLAVREPHVGIKEKGASPFLSEQGRQGNGDGRLSDASFSTGDANHCGWVPAAPEPHRSPVAIRVRRGPRAGRPRFGLYWRVCSPNPGCHEAEEAVRPRSSCPFFLQHRYALSCSEHRSDKVL